MTVIHSLVYSTIISPAATRRQIRPDVRNSALKAATKFPDPLDSALQASKSASCPASTQ